MQAIVPLLEGLEVDANTFRLGLSQVIGRTVIDYSGHIQGGPKNGTIFWTP